MLSPSGQVDAGTVKHNFNVLMYCPIEKMVTSAFEVVILLSLLSRSLSFQDELVEIYLTDFYSNCLASTVRSNAHRQESTLTV